MLQCNTSSIYWWYQPLDRKNDRPLMSRQLSISSLFSVLALVMLALFARAGTYADMQVGQGEVLVQVQDVVTTGR